MQSTSNTPKKPATGSLVHPPASAIGIARAAANEAQGKLEIDDVQECRWSSPLPSHGHKVNREHLQLRSGTGPFEVSHNRLNSIEAALASISICHGPSARARHLPVKDSRRHGYLHS